MSYGVKIFDSIGNVRLDVSDSCVHYLGSVSKYYAKPGYKVTYTDTIACPVSYVGRYICIIVIYSPYGGYYSFKPYVYTKSISNGNSVDIEIGAGALYNTNVSIYFLGV